MVEERTSSLRKKRVQVSALLQMTPDRPIKAQSLGFLIAKMVIFMVTKKKSCVISMGDVKCNTIVIIILIHSSHFLDHRFLEGRLCV